MKDLILIRGLPGAGKSTLAKLLAEARWPVYSVDDFFTDAESGDYKFEFDKNHLAYKACGENTRKALSNGVQKVFVDNTFTLEWEMKPYFEMASEYKYRLHIVTVENYHGGKNSHLISDEQISKMAEKYRVRLF